MRSQFWGLGLAVSLCLGAAAQAQVPADIAAKVHAACGRIDFTVMQAYAPLQPKEPYTGVEVTRDVAYGPDPLQKLDVFDPQRSAPSRDDQRLAKATRRPVLLFVHGGGFTRGDKKQTDNMLLWGASNGMVGVDINYRLAPKDPWPAGQQDLKAAIAWVRANITRFGGDPDRIFLWGHSAGANHVADYVGHTELQGPEARGVKGAIIMSAFYPAALGAQPNPYYGSDPSLQTSDASVARMVKAKVPLYVINAECDPEGFVAYETALDAGLTKAGTAHGRLVAKDHGHLDEGLAVGTDDHGVTDPLLVWLKAHF
jgi:triacylglycerol lipase